MNNNSQGFNITGFIIRLIVSMIVVALTNFLVPGMSNDGGILNLAIIALVIAFLDHVVTRFLGLSRATKGIAGFLVMALILYVSGIVVTGFNVSIVGALIGGIVYGIVDAIIPGGKL